MPQPNLVEKLGCWTSASGFHILVALVNSCRGLLLLGALPIKIAAERFIQRFSRLLTSALRVFL